MVVVNNAAANNNPHMHYTNGHQTNDAQQMATQVEASRIALADVLQGQQQGNDAHEQGAREVLTLDAQDPDMLELNNPQFELEGVTNLSQKVEDWETRCQRLVEQLEKKENNEANETEIASSQLSDEEWQMFETVCQEISQQDPQDYEKQQYVLRLVSGKSLEQMRLLKHVYQRVHGESLESYVARMSDGVTQERARHEIAEQRELVYERLCGFVESGDFSLLLNTVLAVPEEALKDACALYYQRKNCDLAEDVNRRAENLGTSISYEMVACYVGMAMESMNPIKLYENDGVMREACQLRDFLMNADASSYVQTLALLRTEDFGAVIGQLKTQMNVKDENDLTRQLNVTDEDRRCILLFTLFRAGIVCLMQIIKEAFREGHADEVLTLMALDRIQSLGFLIMGHAVGGAGD